MAQFVSPITINEFIKKFLYDPKNPQYDDYVVKIKPDDFFNLVTGKPVTTVRDNSILSSLGIPLLFKGVILKETKDLPIQRKKNWSFAFAFTYEKQYFIYAREEPK